MHGPPTDPGLSRATLPGMSLEESLGDSDGAWEVGHDMVRATPMDHGDRVCVDRDYRLRRWVVSHALTGERTAFEGALWTEAVEAIADDDGFMCLFGQECPPTLVDDVLTERVYVGPDGELVLAAHEHGGTVFVGKLRWLNRQFDLGTLSFTLGANRAQKSQEVVIFQRELKGARVWFNMLSLYDFAGFDFKVKYPSVWLHKHLAAWQDMLQRFGLGGHVRKSKPYDESEVPDDRILPFVTVSGFGLFALLGAWRHATQRRCGMGSSPNIAAADGVLAAMLEWVSTDEWHLLLFLDADVEFAPPRPRQGSHPVLLRVSNSTSVDMAPLREAAERGGMGDDIKMACWLCEGIAGDREVLLSELIHLAWSTAGHLFGRSLGRQLVWELGARLELTVSRMHKGERLDGKVTMRVNECLGGSDYQLDLTIKRYVDSTVAAFRGGMFHSFTVDKSRVGTLDVMNGAAANESNLAAWMVPQVVADFTSEIDVALLTEGEAAAQGELKRRRERQEAWVGRYENEPEEWQAKKRPRTASYNFIRYLDNQVRLATGKGLCQYQQHADERERPHPSLWPKVSLCIDQESSGICAVGYLERQLHVNVEVCYDLAHGGWRDIIASLKQCGMWASTLVCLLAYNVPNGPWASDARFHELKAAMQDLTRNTSPKECPLFMAALPELMQENGKFEILVGDGSELALWRDIFATAPWETKGDRVAVNRFFGVRRKAAAEVKTWHQKAFAWQFLCLEQGFLRGAKFRRLLVRADTAAEPGATTSSKTVAAHEKTLRSACQNCAVIAALVYSSEDNLTMQKVFVVVSQPLDKWHSEAAHVCRNVYDTRKFLAEQVGGRFFETMAAVLRTTTTATCLAEVGFRIPARSRAPGPPRNDDDSLAMVKEGTTAAEMGLFALTLVGCRLKRCASWLRGWPGRAAGCLLPDARGDFFLDELRSDFEAFRHMSEQPASPGISDWLRRSSFNKVAVQQVRSMAALSEWTMTADLKEWLLKLNAKIAVSLLVEDGFQKQKAKTDRQNSHKAREQRAFGTLLGSQVISRSHHYDEVTATPQTEGRAAKLSLADYRPPFAQCSLENACGIIGKVGSSKPAWYSPGVDSLATEHLDHALAKFCIDNQCESMCQNAWLGILLKASHQIVVRLSVGGRTGRWCFACCDVPNTCSIVYPAKQLEVPGRPGVFYFDFDHDIKSFDDLLFPIVNLQWVEAWSFEWRSPMWLAKRFPDLMATTFDGGRLAAMAVGQAEPLLHVAARQCFWSLGLTQLAMLAKHLEFEVPRTKGLFPMLVSIVQQVLDIDGLAASDILKLRLATTEPACLTELMELDEAYEVMDNNEKEEAQQQQKAATAAKSEHDEFRRCFSEHRELTLASARPRNGARPARAKAKTKARPLPPGSLSQALVRPLVPPGGSIWRNNRSDGFEAHYPPFKRVSFSGTVWGGSRNSAVHCLRYLWNAHSTMTGEARDSCPIEDLWEDTVMAPAQRS